MGIEDSKIVSEVLKDLAHNTQTNCKTALRQFMRFINNGAESGFTIDEVIREVEADTKLAQEHIDNFYKWLQNKEVAGYQLRGKTMKESSAYQKAVKPTSYNLSRRFKPPLPLRGCCSVLEPHQWEKP